MTESLTTPALALGWITKCTQPTKSQTEPPSDRTTEAPHTRRYEATARAPP